MSDKPDYHPNGFDPKILDQYPYLQMTEAELNALFEGDPVLRGFETRVIELAANIQIYEARRIAFRERMNVLENRRAELEAELKQNDTETRELRGADKGMLYHIGLAKRRITERTAAIGRRRKMLFGSEVKKRLNQMGRDLRLNIGRRAAKGMEGTVVIAPPI